MEHLHDGSSEPSIQVPYLCNQMYDGGDFDSYPLRAGFDVPTIASSNFESKTREACIGFLQSWLYFGLLSDFFGALAEFRLSDFINHADNGSRTVTTRKLPYIIRKWNALEQAKAAEDRVRAFQRTKYRLLSLHNLAVFFCEGVPSGDGKIRTIQLLPAEVSLSIQILADTLQHAGHEIYKGRYNIEWGFSSFLTDQLRRAGWCPRAITTCTKGQEIHNLYYASTLGEPPVGRNHGSCDDHFCKWEHIEVETYVTGHRPDCTKAACFLRGPEVPSLVQKYSENKTPLINFDEESDSINLSDSNAISSYVAISHV